ncbi:MAG TPA: glycosyltransferase family 4 protein, partial [Candidatus Ozemobacteraceae bacterium]|nr:glycosyltransferase family 4 protein [Candidatus Ozemobacteraceae bacterium]
EKFDSYAATLAPHARIIRHDIVQGIEKENLLREAHFLLLPSRYPNEGQPLVLIEGLAFGCVLIGTDYRALGDMIKPEQTGCFVETTPRSIATAIAHLADNPDEYQQLSTGALQLYHEEFTPTRHIDRLLQVLHAAAIMPSVSATRAAHQQHDP